MLGAWLALDAAGVVPVPDRHGPARRPTGPASQRAARLVAGLGERSVSKDYLAQALRGVAQAAREAAGGAGQALVSSEESSRAIRANAAGLGHELVSSRVRYDEFFHVRRVTGLTAHELRLGVLDTVMRTCEDAALAPLALPELADLVRGMRSMLGEVEREGDSGAWAPGVGTGEPSHARDDQAAHGGAAASVYSDGERSLWRWVTGHHIFALCCEFGRDRIARAESALGDPSDHDAGAVELGLADTFVRAGGAAMSYAAALPRAVYASHIRPLMDAASGRAHGFSGIDNYDYLLLRESWERLHRTLLERASASELHPGVASAAVELFAAIVEENERHTLIAGALVGNAPSLKQEHEVTPIAGGPGTPAVESLRQNTDQRRDMLETLSAQIAAQNVMGRDSVPRSAVLARRLDG